MDKLVKIGKSEVLSTPLGQGTNAVGGNNLFPNLVDKNGIAVVKTALDDGINQLDTAFVYGMGKSEELIGQAIKGYDRKKIVIATKGAQRVTKDGDVVIDNSPEFLRQTVENSLKRLQTDYLDIFYLHFKDDHTPFKEIIDTLVDLKKEGKIRAIGVSNLTLEQLKEANRTNQIDVDEEMFNLIDQKNKDRFPYLKEHNISFVPFFPLASGLLTGKYTKEKPNFASDDIRHDDPNFSEPKYTEIVEKVSKLAPIAKQYNVSITDIVLAWYIANPDITVVIPGAKRPEQVDANAKAMQVNLSKKDYDFIANLFS